MYILIQPCSSTACVFQSWRERWTEVPFPRRGSWIVAHSSRDALAVEFREGLHLPILCDARSSRYHGNDMVMLEPCHCSKAFLRLAGHYCGDQTSMCAVPLLAVRGSLRRECHVHASSVLASRALWPVESPMVHECAVQR